MRTAAIVVVREFNWSTESSSRIPGAQFRNRNLALLNVLGQSILTRTIFLLQCSGISPICVLSSVDLRKTPLLDWNENTAALDFNASGDHYEAIERLLFACKEIAVKAIVLIQLSAYAELDYFEILRFHWVNGKRITSVADSQGPLQIAVATLNEQVESAEFFQDLCLASSFDCDMSNVRPYLFPGYVNRLESVANLRQLARDALGRRCKLRPIGREIRPGVWVGTATRADARTRIIAPAYIGAHCKLRAASLVTSNSSIEHHCEIDCASVIDDSHVLPFSYVGPGIALTHALLDGGSLVHQAHNLELQISDRRLLGRIRSPGRILTVRDRALARIWNAVSPQRLAGSDASQPTSLFTAHEAAP